MGQGLKMKRKRSTTARMKALTKQRIQTATTKRSVNNAYLNYIASTEAVSSPSLLRTIAPDVKLYVSNSFINKSNETFISEETKCKPSEVRNNQRSNDLDETGFNITDENLIDFEKNTETITIEEYYYISDTFANDSLKYSVPNDKKANSEQSEIRNNQKSSDFDKTELNIGNINSIDFEINAATIVTEESYDISDTLVNNSLNYSVPNDKKANSEQSEIRNNQKSSDFDKTELNIGNINSNDFEINAESIITEESYYISDSIINDSFNTSVLNDNETNSEQSGLRNYQRTNDLYKIELASSSDDFYNKSENNTKLNINQIHKLGDNVVYRDVNKNVLAPDEFVETEQIENQRDRRTNDQNETVFDDLHQSSNQSATVNYPTNIFSLFAERRRIVDMPYFLSELLIFGQHNSAKCPGSLRDVHFYRITNIGLNTLCYIKCRKCGYYDQIYTNDPRPIEEPSIEEAAVISVLASKKTISSFRTSLAVLDVPCFSDVTHIKWRQKLTTTIRKALNLALRENASQEQKLAVENDDVIGDNKIPCCTVVIDGAFAKRSYVGGKYDSLGGVVAVIGYRTQKLIDVVIYNQHCSICVTARNQKVEPPDHECFANYDHRLSSTSMESAGAVAAFKRSRELNGLIYNVVIADDDSSTFNALINANVYSDVNITVQKIKCINHLFRSMGSKIARASIEKTTASQRGVMGFLRKKIKGSAIRIRRVIESEVDRLRKDFDSENLSKEEKYLIFERNTEELRKNILIVPYHVFGHHDDCPSFWTCNKSKPDFVTQLKKVNLFDRIIKIVTDLSKNSEHLLHKVHTNIVEQYFSILWQYICEKGYNFYKRDDFEKRVIMSALHQATSGATVSRIFRAMDKTVNASIIKLENSNTMHRLKNARNRKNMKNEKKSKHNCQGTDKDYGPESCEPDKSDDQLQKECELHKQKLLSRQNNRLEHEAQTKVTLQYGCSHEFEKDMIPSTYFGKICRMAETTSCARVVEDILSEPLTFDNATLQLMGYHRNRALQHLECEVINEKIFPCGLFISIDDQFFFTCARPDGLTRQDSIVIVTEITDDENSSLIEALKSRKWKNLFSPKHPQQINVDHPMYYNIQGQLHVTGKQYCYFAAFSMQEDNWIRCAELIRRDDNFWNRKMKNKLERFYYSVFVYEIVDSRAARSMPIREAPHTIEAKSRAATKAAVKEATNNQSVTEQTKCSVFDSFIENEDGTKSPLALTDDSSDSEDSVTFNDSFQEAFSLSDCEDFEDTDEEFDNDINHELNTYQHKIYNHVNTDLVSAILQQVVKSTNLKDITAIWQNNSEFISRVCSEIESVIGEVYSKTSNNTISTYMLKDNFPEAQDARRSKIINNSFRIVNVVGDGNCFYRSVSELIFNDENRHLEIRLFIINHILNNIHDYGPFISNGVISITSQYHRSNTSEGAKVFDFLKLMIAPTTVWANEGSIYAICDGLNINVVSIMIDPKTKKIIAINKFVPQSPRTDTPLTLINEINLHYLAAHTTTTSLNFKDSVWEGLKIYCIELQAAFKQARKTFEKRQIKNRNLSYV